jgi:hypothetical protein
MPTYRMTVENVRQIMALHSDGHGERSISYEIDQNEETVRNVLRGKTWRHITGGRLAKGRRPSKQLARYREAAQ